MLKNYLLVAVRNLFRNKIVSLVHIVGFGLGIAAFLFVAQVAVFEYSFDNFHKNGNQIYQITADYAANGDIYKAPAIEPALAPLLKNAIPEVSYAARYIPQLLEEPYCMVTHIDSKGNRKTFNESNARYVDEDFLKIFEFEILMGSNTPLQTSNGLVMTRSCSQKYFGKENPIGKILELTTGGTESNKTKFTYQVETILEDIPSNSSLQFDILLPFRSFEDNYKSPIRTNWYWHASFLTFIMVQDHIDFPSLESKIYQVVPEEVKKDWHAFGMDAITYRLRGLPNAHFDSERYIGYSIPLLKVTDKSYLLILVLIGFAILLIAEMNYISLTTAKALKRIKEISIRKIVGADRKQLVTQFFLDACLNVMAGLVSALTLLQVVKPLLAQWLGLSVPRLDSWNNQYLFFFIVFVISVGLTGFIPAYFLSRQFPVSALKGKANHAPGISVMRKCLVTFQFTTSVILICTTYVIVTQLNFMRSKDTGVSMEQRIVISAQGTEDLDFQKFRRFKDRLSNNKNVVSVSAGVSIPGKYLRGGGQWSPMENPAISKLLFFTHIPIEADFMKTLGIPVVAGSEFTVDRISDERVGLINETALRMLGYGAANEALGKILNFHWVEEKREVKIIGVVEDANFVSPGEVPDPMVFTFANTTHPYPKYKDYIVHLSTNQFGGTIDEIKKVWENTFPDAPFEYSFLHDQFQRVFEQDEKIESIATMATTLAIFIACIGLGALVAYSVTLRTKEIGIRKVLGASVTRILFLLANDFIKLILIAIVVALPLTWYAVNDFLKNYQYRIQFSIWIFVVPCLLLLIIAALTTGHQTIKAANSNPVDALKCE